jgi:hypothetical protein
MRRWRGGDRRRRGGDIITGTTTTMDTDGATIAAVTTPRGEGEGEEGAVASSGRRSRVCVDFGHRRGRLRCQHRPSSTSAIVVTVG